MDRLNQLRAGAEGGQSGDSTLDTSSPPSEAYMSANESSSKYFSFSESTFDITPIKDVSLASAASATEPDHTLTDPDELLSNLSPITKKDVMLDSYKIGKQIEAANILSGGVDIFEDNDNSFDGDELVIDDNVEMDDKSNLDDKLDEVVSEATLIETHVDLDNKDTEVVLQIDGKNVDAIDIGNGLYLYRKAGQDELAAVQIITEDNQQAPSFKFLKVRENVEGNLEVYEEFEIEVSNKDPVNEAKPSARTPRSPVKGTSKAISESANKIIEKKDKTPPKDATTSKIDVDTESKTELNLNGKMMKFNESRKSPVVGSFTPMTYHSTPNKEGKPLTKTMVDQQLHPSRHSDNVKKTIEVHTDNQTKKLVDECNKQKAESQVKKVNDNITTKEISSTATETIKKEQPENQDKKYLEKDNDNTSVTNAELQNVAKISSDDQAKAKIDDIIPSNINIVETTKLFVDNKLQEQKAGPSKALEVEIKDSNDNEKTVNSPKPKDSGVSAKTIRDIENKNIIFCSLLGATKVDQILKSETDIIPRLKSNVLDKTNETGNISSIDDEKGSSNKDTNITVVESTKPKTIKVDQALKKLKGVDEQKLFEKVQVTAGNTIDLFSTNENKEATKKNVTITQESPKTVKDISSSSSLEQAQTLQLVEIHKVFCADNKKPIEEMKNIAVSKSIPRASKLETSSKLVKDTEKKEVNATEKVKETETKTLLEPEKSSKDTNEFKTKKVNSNAQVNERNVTKLSIAKETEANQDLLIEKTNQVENKTDLVLQPSKLKPKGIDSETELNIEKSNPVVKSIEPTTDLQHDKLNIVANLIEQTTVLKTEKLYPVSKVELKGPTAETNSEIKLEPETVSQINKIPVAIGKEPDAFPKTFMLHSETKIDPVTIPQNYKVVAVPKTKDTKIYSKPEIPKLFPKGIETKAVSKLGVANPVTKAFELKTVPKTVLLNPIPKGIEPKSCKSVKAMPIPAQVPKSNAVIITSNKLIVPINNNHSAVPFGKWTDANRQEFLNKFKEIKVPATSNTKQIKNSNDLNRIDILKKIDSQRSNTASAKGQDKSNVKDTVFSTKIAQPKVETKIPVKNEGLKIKAKPDGTNETVTSTVSSNASTSDVATPEAEERREVNVNDLIGRAIVDMLNRPVPMPMTRSPLDEPRHADNNDAHLPQTEPNADQNNLKTDPQRLNIDQQKLKTDPQKLNIDQQKLKTDPQKQDIDQQKLNIDQQKQKIEQQSLNADQQKLNIDEKIDEDSSGSLDDIEMKMNELHGIPFVERPPHELPRVHKTYSKSSKANKNAKSLSATSKHNLVQENVIDLESDEEVIEHEPITGDIDLSKKAVSKLPAPVKTHVSESTTALIKEARKKEPVFTENDFDKFARRNSVTLENCLTVNFDSKVPANVVQTVKENDALKVYPRNEKMRLEATTKLPQKQTLSQTHATKIPNTKLPPAEDPNNKNYQSKIHSAYQSALTAKRQMDRPISIIEDKPVKVVFMDANAEFIPNQLNVQGKELSPAKKASVETTKVSPQTVSSDTIDDKQDDSKIKSKHQRKQVLTPVEAPDLELIQPRDIGLDVSPKKKRKTDDNKNEKTLKNLVHKKSYLLGRAVNDEETTTQEVMNPVTETINRAETVAERTVSAIDSLVKAAELLENQSVDSASPNPDSQQNTPLKRGRGRPRKYPLADGASESKIASPSPHKKPRLIDAKPVKRDPISDEGSSDDEQMIRENWTMGKINENIVCPICNKLFRSENVVFKHVKHCTGVSPTRSDLEKRSPRRRKYSRDSDSKSFDSQSDDLEFEEKPKESVKKTPKNRKPKESMSKLDEVDVIVIEDTPVKELVSEKESISKTMEEKQQKLITVPEPAKEIAQETQQTLAEESPVKEKTLKEISEAIKLAKAKNLDEVSDEITVKTKKVEESTEEKPAKAKKLPKITLQTSNLVCEFCGKTFRQLSYLANHKLQHKREQLKKLEAKLTAKLQVFSCEVCKKEFRTLHHLVQHRISHNSEAPARTSRKSSSEQSETKVKEQPAPKQNDDTSAGFRCEPCDKSFRKLHHLVEHRETHDGINRQKTNAQTVVQPIEKPPPPPQCDVCKKSFRKLHHLSEHKEQHHVEQVETSSEKSDDKSVQSSLSTRDIIHECSLCYMVFPNEHSLNKHFINCQQKKKRQSKAKDKPENVDGVDPVEESTNIDDSMDTDGELIIVAQEILDDDKVEIKQVSKNTVPEKIEQKRNSEKPASTEKTPDAQKPIDVSEIPVPKVKEVTELKSAPAKRVLPISDENSDVKKVVPEKIKKIDEQQIKDLPKKTPVKDKVAPSVTKRQKSLAPLPVLPEGKLIESSDDDEVRYMLNPNFKGDETSEGKVFMKVRSNKRNSLQIERPNSRELMNRRTSLQHPPKIPRLKAKAVVPKIVPTVTKHVPKLPKNQAASTDSDDNDVKYSFPKTVMEPASKVEEPKEKKIPRKSLAEKRKSLSGLAKRKSVGQTIAKLKAEPSPVRVIKRRTLEVEHRCDCGQLFNSAALLTRHTSLAHTPPRIRRRRSPPPDSGAKPPRDSPPKTTRKSSVKSEASTKPTRKSSVKSDTPETRKSMKSDQSQKKRSSAKSRTPAHRGVPVPEKMRKLMMNAK